MIKNQRIGIRIHKINAVGAGKFLDPRIDAFYFKLYMTAT